LQLVSEIQSRVPGEAQTLPIYVAMQASSGHKDVAAAAIRSACTRPTPPETLVRLAAINRANQLGAEQELTEKIGAEEASSPTLALAQATELARNGKKQEGLEFLTRTAAATTQPAQWQLAVAKYRDMIGDAGAKDSWIALGDANTTDIAIQSTILSS